MIENRLLNKRELGEYMGVSIGKVELMMSDGLKYIKMNRNVANELHFVIKRKISQNKITPCTLC